VVDFKSRLKKGVRAKAVDPVELYDKLDRASDKGPLRPAQAAVLTDWHANRRSERDLIIKLHTGQGKTLIGLLMLQSRLNEGKGPALYLCPNRFLVEQTCWQAQSFGIEVVTTDGDLPDAFLSSERILVTSIQKLFNGLTKFGLDAKSQVVGTLVMDDSHACVDAIQSAFTIRLSKDHIVRKQLLDLFAYEMEKQGAGTFAELRQGHHEALLPVPYWDWIDKQQSVTEILVKHLPDSEIKFPWPLLRDRLAHCQCVISGTELEIAPYVPDLEPFGSYAKATHRAFMSATVTDDSFLVKGLGLSPETIRQPLTYAKETWSGEKMILIPSLIDESLSADVIAPSFAASQSKRQNGFVALVPSFKAADVWEQNGAIVAERKNIDAKVAELRSGVTRDKTLVIVNRYDGIDLPDDSCRVLVFDSKPLGESLIDRHSERCRVNSEAITTKIVRKIEQGMGRSVRGEKDYCAILLIGADLIKVVRAQASQQFFSDQTRQQIRIGFDIAEYAKADIIKGTPAWDALIDLVFNKLVSRDEGWKEFYAEQMNAMTPAPAPSKMLDVFSDELAAERDSQKGIYDAATKKIQQLVDNYVKTDTDRGWYLQEMARFQYGISKSESNRLQVEAHRRNTYLLKPQSGMIVRKLVLVSPKRMERIIDWLSGCGTFESLRVTVDAILSDLEFGVDSDRFEKALDDLGRLLGYETQRPDDELNEGPDNLWAVSENEYFVIECKNEVEASRAEIHKKESGQFSNAVSWFKKNYPAAHFYAYTFHPAQRFGMGAGCDFPVLSIGPKGLKKFKDRVRAFVKEFSALDLTSLSAKQVQQFIDAHDLSDQKILGSHASKVKSS
jgi:replicative superfamily II helicase